MMKRFPPATRARYRGTHIVCIALAFSIISAVSGCDRPTLPLTRAEVSVDTAATAPTTGLAPVEGLRWSDATTWPDNKLPVAGADVEIPEGTRVVLDVATPPLGSLVIRGELVAANKPVALTAGRIDVYGALRIGTPEAPHTARVVITLIERANDPSPTLTKGIIVFTGGTLDMFGEERVAWTKLARTANAGATALELATPVDWRAGDVIVLTPSGYWQSETELATVRAVDGTSVQLSEGLKNQHWGELQQIAGTSVDERAEVGLLTHNIVVQGDSSSEQAGHGGHIMVLSGGTTHIDGVELYRMGQKGEVARYPMHWHMAGSVKGQYVVRSSVWHSFNRCMTIHGSHDARLEDNVCYDHTGHGYFLEDGIETGNVIRENLAVFSRRGTIIPSDNNPANFWITNPDNTFENNVAAGSVAFGYWISAPKHPTGYSATDAIWPMYTPLRRFDGNVVHSAEGDGMHVEEDGSTYGHYSTDYRPRENGDPNAAPVVAVYSRLTAYKNNRGFWSRGDYQRIEHSVFADNTVGVQIGDAALESEGEVASTLIVGTTRNGEPRAQTRIGFRIYDGPVKLSDVTFANFMGGNSAAMAPEPGFDGRMSPRNRATGVRFENALPVLFAAKPGPDGERFAILRDVDGSVSGVPGSTIFGNTQFLMDPTCQTRSAWNAHVCSAGYAGIAMYDARDAAPAVVTREDGVTGNFTGYSPTMLWLAGATRHTYTVKPSNFTQGGGYGVAAEGLEVGEWITVATPWQLPEAKVSFPRQNWKPIPMVQSLAELDASSVTTAYLDTAAGTMYIRFVGEGGFTAQRANVSRVN